MLIVLISLLVLTFVVAFVFIKTSPQFGGSHSDADIHRYQESGHYVDGKFVNLTSTNIDYSFKNMVKMIKAYWKGNPNKSPKNEPPVIQLDTSNWSKENRDQIMWFGHSAFLLQIDDKNILIDPMLGISPSPHPAIGTKRYARELPAEIEELPQIDFSETEKQDLAEFFKWCDGMYLNGFPADPPLK